MPACPIRPGPGIAAGTKRGRDARTLLVYPTPIRRERRMDRRPCPTGRRVYPTPIRRERRIAGRGTRRGVVRLFNESRRKRWMAAWGIGG